MSSGRLVEDRATIELIDPGRVWGQGEDIFDRVVGQALAHVNTVLAERPGQYLRMDAATRRNLELTETLRGETSPTLFSLLDECATGMGSRLLRHWLHHPLRDRAALSARHDAVSTGFDVHKVLRRFSDVERITARLALKSVRPRELAGLRESLKLLPELRQALPDTASLLRELADHLQTPVDALALLEKAIHLEPAARVVDGGVIADGYSADLDELRRLQNDSGQFLVELEAREKARTGIPNLRVAYNSVHGYYIEVTSSHVAKVPDDYRRRQTLKNAERYITPELKDFEDKELGKVVPYGVYDVGANAGWVSVGVTSDTAQFAVASIRRWLDAMGA